MSKFSNIILLIIIRVFDYTCFHLLFACHPFYYIRHQPIPSRFIATIIVILPTSNRVNNIIAKLLLLIFQRRVRRLISNWFLRKWLIYCSEGHVRLLSSHLRSVSLHLFLFMLWSQKYTYWRVTFFIIIWLIDLLNIYIVLANKRIISESFVIRILGFVRLFLVVCWIFFIFITRYAVASDFLCRYLFVNDSACRQSWKFKQTWILNHETRCVILYITVLLIIIFLTLRLLHWQHQLIATSCITCWSLITEKLRRLVWKTILIMHQNTSLIPYDLFKALFLIWVFQHQVAEIISFFLVGHYIFEFHAQKVRGAMRQEKSGD